MTTVSGTVFYDADSDGVLGSGDTPIADIGLRLISGVGVTVGTTATDATGAYSFDVTAPGGTFTLSVTTPAYAGSAWLNQIQAFTHDGATPLVIDWPLQPLPNTLTATVAAYVGKKYGPAAAALGLTCNDAAIDCITDDVFMCPEFDANSTTLDLTEALRAAIDFYFWEWAELQTVGLTDWSADGGNFKQSQIAKRVHVKLQQSRDKMRHLGLCGHNWGTMRLACVPNACKCGKCSQRGLNITENYARTGYVLNRNGW